jgi:hypothetical protein
VADSGGIDSHDDLTGSGCRVRDVDLVERVSDRGESECAHGRLLCRRAYAGEAGEVASHP